MNKLKLFSTIALSILAFSYSAQADEKGGFSGPGTDVALVSITQAKDLKDDTLVVLRGNIQRQIGNELYIFTDGNDTINIEIDDDNWNGQNITPEDLIEIKGEVDKGLTSIEIDVDHINKVKP